MFTLACNSRLLCLLALIFGIWDRFGIWRRGRARCGGGLKILLKGGRKLRNFLYEEVRRWR